DDRGDLGPQQLLPDQRRQHHELPHPDPHAELPAAAADPLGDPRQPGVGSDRRSAQERLRYGGRGPLLMSNLIYHARFVLSDSDPAAIEEEMHHYEDPRAASIEALKIVQQARGWVPDGAADAIGEILGIPASDVEGVATFYSQIFRQPVGRHIIRVCDSMTC